MLPVSPEVMLRMVRELVLAKMRVDVLVATRPQPVTAGRRQIVRTPQGGFEIADLRF